MKHFFFPRKPQVLLLRPLTDQIRPTHATRGNAHLNQLTAIGNHIDRIPSQPHLNQCWIKHLRALAQPNGCIKLTTPEGPGQRGASG